MRTAGRALTVLVILLLIAASAAGALFAAALRGYARLTYEQPVAELEFAARGPQQYQGWLSNANGLSSTSILIPNYYFQSDI